MQFLLKLKLVGVGLALVGVTAILSGAAREEEAPDGSRTALILGAIHVVDDYLRAMHQGDAGSRYGLWWSKLKAEVARDEFIAFLGGRPDPRKNYIVKAEVLGPKRVAVSWSGELEDPTKRVTWQVVLEKAGWRVAAVRGVPVRLEGPTTEEEAAVLSAAEQFVSAWIAGDAEAMAQSACLRTGAPLTQTQAAEWAEAKKVRPRKVVCMCRPEMDYSGPEGDIRVLVYLRSRWKNRDETIPIHEWKVFIETKEGHPKVVVDARPAPHRVEE